MAYIGEDGFVFESLIYAVEAHCLDQSGDCCTGCVLQPESLCSLTNVGGEYGEYVERRIIELLHLTKEES